MRQQAKTATLAAHRADCLVLGLTDLANQFIEGLSEMKSSAHFFLGTVSLLALVSAAGVALAQPTVTREQQRSTEAPRALPTREPENFDPRGVAVGSFRLFPVVELQTEWNSNIYATERNEVDDVVFYVAPSLELRSDWNNHALNLVANAKARRYADNDNEDAERFTLGFDGRIDVRRDINLFGGASYMSATEDRSSPDATAAREPTQYDLMKGNAGYFHRFGRFNARLEGGFDDYNFADDTTGAGANINNDDRDRLETRQSLRLGYEIIPDYEAFVRGTLRQVNYDSTLDDAGFARSGNGYEAVGGLRVELSRITNVEGYVGYLSREYDDARLSTIDGVSFGAAVNWSPRRELNLRGYITREVRETTSANFSGFLSTAFGLEGSYKLFPRLQLTGDVSYETNQYERVSTFAGTEREDDVWNASIGAKYFVTTNVYAGPMLSYSSRESNVVNASYDQTKVMIRLGWQY